MSRSALWRQEANVQERERHAYDTYQAAVAEGRNCRAKGLIPLHGPDDTFNIHPVLLAGIRKSPYFIKCYENLKDWNAIADEIYYEVKHVEPWVIGPKKAPSSALCLLVRLFTIRCTEKQMKLMLDHVDSPYIRCIGFLYLRYCADPKTLWHWFEPYLYDEEKVRVEANQGKPEITIGAYVQNLLSNMDYHGTLLPRLPVAVGREVETKLREAEQCEDRARQHLKDSSTMEYLKVGNSVRALYGDEENPVTWYDAVIDRVILYDDDSGAKLSRPKYCVTFPEYGNTEVVTLGELDLPNGGRAYSGTSNRHEVHGGQKSRRRDYGERRKTDRFSAGERRRRDFNRSPRREASYETSRDRSRYQAGRESPRGASGNRGRSHGDYERRRRSRSRSEERNPHVRRNIAGQKRSQHDLESHHRKNDPKFSGGEQFESPSRPKRAKDSAAIAEKKRKLMAKYG